MMLLKILCVIASVLLLLLASFGILKFEVVIPIVSLLMGYVFGSVGETVYRSYLESRKDSEDDI